MGRRSTNWRQLFIVTVALLGATTGVAAAQGRAEGSIAGTVTDETKAVLPGVTVTATSPATGLRREAITDEGGTFTLPGLPPGAYDVIAVLQGFTTFRQTVTVTVGAEIRIGVQLRVATVQETITVTGEAPLVEVTRTEQGATITRTKSAICRSTADPSPILRCWPRAWFPPGPAAQVQGQVAADFPPQASGAARMP